MIKNVKSVFEEKLSHKKLSYNFLSATSSLIITQYKIQGNKPCKDKKYKAL